MKKKLIAIIVTALLLCEMGTTIYAAVLDNNTAYSYSEQNNSTNNILKTTLRKKGLIRYLLDGEYDNITDGVKKFFEQAYGDDIQGNNTNENKEETSLNDDDFNLDIGNSIKEDEDDENTKDDTENAPANPPITEIEENKQNSQVVPKTPEPEQSQVPQPEKSQPKQTTPETVTPTQPSKKEVTPSTTPKQVQPQTSANQNTSDKFMAQVEQMIFTKVNQEREKAGVAKLSYSTTMEKYSRIKSQDMGDKGYFRHEDPAGNLITARMQKDGVKYSAWGENIAYIGGVSDANALANQFMTNWMNSPGHRANILSNKFTGIGVGVYKIGNKVYATQEFIR